MAKNSYRDFYNSNNDTARKQSCISDILDIDVGGII